jgi:hypothetical protein
MGNDPLDALRAAALVDPEIPEDVRGFLRSGARLERLSLDRLGRWSFQGGAVEHSRVLALFNRSLHRTAAGTWVLRVPPFTYPVLVEGVGRFIRRLGSDSEGWFGTTTGDVRVPLRGAELITDGERFLGARVNDELHRFIESAHQDVLSMVELDPDGRWRASTPDGPRILADLVRGLGAGCGPDD